jgi:hypothetical protein
LHSRKCLAKTGQIAEMPRKIGPHDRFAAAQTRRSSAIHSKMPFCDYYTQVFALVYSIFEFFENSLKIRSEPARLGILLPKCGRHLCLSGFAFDPPAVDRQTLHRRVHVHCGATIDAHH